MLHLPWASLMDLFAFNVMAVVGFLAVVFTYIGWGYISALQVFMMVLGYMAFYTILNYVRKRLYY